MPVGKWITRDIIEEIKQPNRYEFNKNNPVEFGDWLGLQSRKITAEWSEMQPTPVGGVVRAPYKYEIELSYEKKCSPNGIAEIRYNDMEGNLVGSLDTSGFSVFVVGVTSTTFVKLGPRGARFQAIPCPNNPSRQKGSLTVHWQVRQKTTIGVNPGILMLSFDLGASVKWGEWVKQEGVEVITIDCCCEEKK